MFWFEAQLMIEISFTPISNGIKYGSEMSVSTLLILLKLMVASESMLTLTGYATWAPEISVRIMLTT